MQMQIRVHHYYWKNWKFFQKPSNDREVESETESGPSSFGAPSKNQRPRRTIHFLSSLALIRNNNNEKPCRRPSLYLFIFLCVCVCLSVDPCTVCKFEQKKIKKIIFIFDNIVYNRYIFVSSFETALGVELIIHRLNIKLNKNPAYTPFCSTFNYRFPHLQFWIYCARRWVQVILMHILKIYITFTLLYGCFRSLSSQPQIPSVSFSFYLKRCFHSNAVDKDKKGNPHLITFPTNAFIKLIKDLWRRTFCARAPTLTLRSSTFDTIHHKVINTFFF